MKAFTSILVMFILAGCSTDDLQPEAATSENRSYKKNEKKDKITNPHAPAGLIYQEMLDTYYLFPESVKDIEQIIDHIEIIAQSNPGFTALNSSNLYSPLSADGLYPYLTEHPIEGLLSQQYSTRARTILTGIASDLDTMKSQDLPFQDVALFFGATDTIIMGDSTLAVTEKNALLITTALIYSALDHDHKRRRRDRDWEWMTTHLAATANAAIESVPQAIMASFAVDVYLN